MPLTEAEELELLELELEAAKNKEVKRKKIKGNDSGSFAAGVYGFNEGVPFGNKITSKLGAYGAKAYDALSGENVTEGSSLQDLYEQAQKDAEVTQESNPVSSGIGNAAGLANSLLIGGGKLGSAITEGLMPNAISNTGRFANTLSKIGLGSAVGGGTSALYSLGNDGDVASDAKMGAVVGGLIPAASAIAKGSRIAAKGLSGKWARNAEELEKAREKLHKEGSRIYKKFKDTGAVIHANKSNEILNNVRKRLIEKGEMDPELHKQTISVYKGLAKKLHNKNVSLEALDQKRQLFSKILAKKANADPDTTFAAEAIEAIDDAILGLGGEDLAKGSEKAVKLLKEAQAKWSKYKRFEKVSDIAIKAGGDPTKIKNGLKTFVNKRKNLKGFSKQEIEFLKDASRATTGEKALKGVGKFGISADGGIIPALTALLGGGAMASGSGVGALAFPLIGAGTIAKPLSKALATGKAGGALEMIEKGVR